jgi:hypothetical protein
MQSPYAPPKSEVSDPEEPQHLFPKPVQVRVAVWLLWIMTALAIPTMYFAYERARSPGEAIVLMFLMSIVLMLAGFLNIQISRGRNWARIVFLIVFALTVLSMTLPDEGPPVSAVESAISAISLVIDIIAAYLLFSWPGSLWFRPRA